MDPWEPHFIRFIDNVVMCPVLPELVLPDTISRLGDQKLDMCTVHIAIHPLLKFHEIQRYL